MALKIRKHSPGVHEQLAWDNERILYIEEGITTVDRNLLEGREEAIEIYFPASVTRIQPGALLGFSQLQEIHFANATHITVWGERSVWSMDFHKPYNQALTFLTENGLSAEIIHGPDEIDHWR